MDLLLALPDEQVREPMRELSQAQIEAMGLVLEVDDALIDQAIAESRMPWMQYFMRHVPLRCWSGSMRPCSPSTGRWM